ncbi:MAG TPA: tetratricopeptide repeat protein [Novimethylophilus sp.]|jgi:predicted negative regulator of RcsB-dependent stress response|uniref:YfgM family protein n=1 Tax=Novimethylophilus sp. TaxID=2137426 RepID=UPI002F40466A
MAYDLEEQEQLDALKAWWHSNGNTVLLAVGALCVAFAGFQGWKYYQHKQRLEASSQYEALAQLDVKDIKQVRSVSGQLMEKYSGTPYAARAALMVARANYEAGDARSAHAQVEWALAHSREETVKSIAQLQLAGLQFEEKKYDDALKTLAEKHDPAYDGLLSDLKGDILAIQGKSAEARKAYAEALASLDQKSKFRRYTEQKLDALGS